MKLTTEREMFPTRIQRLLRWSQRLLFIAGSLALSYVGFTLLEGRLFQASAKRSLENQIQMEKDPNESQPKPAVKKGDVLGRVDIPRLGISVAVLQGTVRERCGWVRGTLKALRFQGKSGTAESPGTATLSSVG